MTRRKTRSKSRGARRVTRRKNALEARAEIGDFWQQSGAAEPSHPGPSDVQLRAAEPNNATPSDAQGRDAQGRDAQGRDVQGRDAQGRDVQGRDAQGRDVQGRDATFLRSETGDQWQQNRRPESRGNPALSAENGDWKLANRSAELRDETSLLAENGELRSEDQRPESRDNAADLSAENGDWALENSRVEPRDGAFLPTEIGDLSGRNGRSKRHDGAPSRAQSAVDAENGEPATPSEALLQSEFPRAAQVADWSASVATLPETKARRDEAETQARERAAALQRRAEIEAEIAPLAALFSDARAAQILAEAARAAREVAHANARIETTRPRWESAQTALKLAQSQREASGQKREPLAQALAQGRGEFSSLARNLEDQRAEIAPDLLPLLEGDDLQIELENWKAEQTRLERENVRARAEKLAEARRQIERLETRARWIEEQIAAFPLEARREVAGIDAELNEAKNARALAAQSLESAARELENLQSARDRKTELVEARAGAETVLRHLEILADLLGPQRLQLHLLQDAQTGILRHANAILDRISAGTLRLELRREELNVQGRARAESALDFVVFHQPEPGQNAESATEIATAQAIFPAFLSGSQRFRVAVALALGIGRYAADGQGSARMESVIIDEGFGALDRVGRDEMLEELRVLGAELQRVILVSHQEDFAAGFPNRYRIEHDGKRARARLESD